MAKRNGGTVGIKTARLALFDENGVIDKTFGDNGIYTIKTQEDGGVATANITGLAPTTTKIWGNNAMVDIAVGSIQPSVAFTTNFLNHDILNRVLGRAKNEDGSYNLEGDANQLVALDIISSDVTNHDVHFAFFGGRMTAGDLSLSTNNENESRVQDALTYSPMTNDKGKIGVIGYSGDDDFDIDLFTKNIFSIETTTTTTTSK